MKRRLIHYSRSSALALLLAMLSACGKDLNQQNGSTGKDNEPFNILVIARDETPKPGVNIDGVTVVSTGFDTDYWTKLYSISQDQLLQENRQRLQGFAQTGDLDPDHKIRWGQSDHDRLDLWPITPASTAVPGRFNVNWVVRETVDGRTFNDNMTATLDAPASLNQGAFLFLHFLPGNRVAADWFANANWDTPETQWTSLAPRQEVVGALGPQRIAMKLLNTSGQNLTHVGIEPVSPAGAAKSPLDQLTEVVLARWWIGGFGDIAAGSPTAPVQDESAECAMERHGAYCEFSVVPADGRNGARLKITWLAKQAAEAWHCEQAEVDVPPYWLKRQVSGVWRTGDVITNTVWIRILPDHRVSAEVRDSALTSDDINASPVKASSIAKTGSVCNAKDDVTLAQCCEDR